MEIKLLNSENIEKNYVDIKEIFAVLNKEKSGMLTTQLYKFLTENKCICIGAYEEKEIVGILWTFKRSFAGVIRYHINYFSVKNNYQNKGIGKMLLYKLKKIAKEEGVSKIDLNVNLDNEKARNFYSNHLFKEEKLLMSMDI